MGLGMFGVDYKEALLDSPHPFNFFVHSFLVLVALVNSSTFVHALSLLPFTDIIYFNQRSSYPILFIMRASFFILAVVLATSTTPGLSLPVGERHIEPRAPGLRTLTSAFNAFKKPGSTIKVPQVVASAAPHVGPSSPTSSIYHTPPTSPVSSVAHMPPQSDAASVGGASMPPEPKPGLFSDPNALYAASSLVSSVVGAATGIASTAQSSALNRAQINSLEVQTATQEAANKANPAAAAQGAPPPQDQGPPPSGDPQSGGSDPYGQNSQAPPGGGSPYDASGAGYPPYKRDLADDFLPESAYLEPHIQHLQARMASIYNPSLMGMSMGMMPMYGPSTGPGAKLQKIAAMTSLASSFVDAGVGISSTEQNAALNRAQIHSLGASTEASQQALAQAQAQAAQAQPQPQPPTDPQYQAPPSDPQSQPPPSDPQSQAPPVQRRSIAYPDYTARNRKREALEILSKRAAAELLRRDPAALEHYVPHLQARFPKLGGGLLGGLRRIVPTLRTPTKPIKPISPAPVNHITPPTTHTNPLPETGSSGSSKLANLAGVAQIASSAAQAGTAIVSTQQNAAEIQAQIANLQSSTEANNAALAAAQGQAAQAQAPPANPNAAPANAAPVAGQSPAAQTPVQSQPGINPQAQLRGGI
ncbi:hypothetical protein K474DRAFT_1712951 [Panus rudis PR-1116 ss-1]|nr:hypothetical protein K474DRAFT_1712951 [Panus rudis PR-1116 ss-1]